MNELYVSYESDKTSNDIIPNVVQNFAESNSGSITDFGLGKTRVLIKLKSSDFIFCLFVSEILYWRITGEILSIFIELTLKDILQSFREYMDLFKYEEKGKFDEDEMLVLNEQIDLLLLEDSKLALKELNY